MSLLLLLIAVNLLAVTFEGKSASTNYSTQQYIDWFDSNGWPRKQEIATESSLPGEQLPAGIDAAWNWGFPNQDFQLSIRFSKEAFLQGEPIVASILLRNLSPTSRVDVVGLPEKLEFNITSDKAPSVQRIDAFKLGAQPRTQGSRRWVLEPNSQRKYKVVLNELFDLSAPGTYRISTLRQVPQVPGQDFGEVTSGTASIQVLGFSANNSNRIASLEFTNIAIAQTGVLAGSTEANATSGAAPGLEHSTTSSSSSVSRPFFGPLRFIISLVGLVLALFGLLALRRARSHRAPR